MEKRAVIHIDSFYVVDDFYLYWGGGKNSGMFGGNPVNTKKDSKVNAHSIYMAVSDGTVMCRFIRSGGKEKDTNTPIKKIKISRMRKCKPITPVYV